MNGVVQGVLIASAGLAVFGGSVVAMLALSGRLNSDGVKDVPILNQIIKEEPEEGDESKKAKPEVKPEAKDASFQKSKDAKKRRELDPRSQDVASRKLFSFEGFQAPTSAKELRRLQGRLEKTVRENELQSAALEKRGIELDLREQDLSTRRESIQKLMAEVERRIDELKNLRRRFETDVTILTAAEKKNLKRQAEQLGAMEPDKAAEFVLELSLEKEALAVKLLVSMDVEQASAILSKIDAKRGARFIERATRVLRQ